MMARPISACRACGNVHLEPILDFGNQALTGRFPAPSEPPAPVGPLVWVRCDDERTPDACGLLQLGHDYNMGQLYGESYGYRSSVTETMVGHLQRKVANLLAIAQPRPGEVVLDIGCNDGTLLRQPAPDPLDGAPRRPDGARRRLQRHQWRQLPPSLGPARDAPPAERHRHCGRRRARAGAGLRPGGDLSGVRTAGGRPPRGARHFLRAGPGGGQDAARLRRLDQGNVVIQYCGLSKADIPAILERYPPKVGRRAPGSDIPIISEADGHARLPDYLFVLPWHFREEILRRETAFLDRGGLFVFQCPRIEIVGRGGRVVELIEAAEGAQGAARLPPAAARAVTS